VSRSGRRAPHVLGLWSALAVLVEVGLYSSYRGHDARFHWFLHFFVGASTALLGMAAVAWRTRRPVPLPLVWPVLVHLVAMSPDLLFTAGYAHRRWMDVVLGHISTHYLPGRDITWYVVFAAALGLYLVVVSRTLPAAGKAQPGP
jgi:hypothetical protein